MDEVAGTSARYTLEDWDSGGDGSRQVYLHPEEYFPATVVRRGEAVRPLPVRLKPEIGEFSLGEDDGATQTLDAFLLESSLDGFLIAYRGEIVFERYLRMQADDRHLIFSVTKAVVGTVLGLLEDEGSVDLDRPIERYLPAFRSTAWAGTSIRDIAGMASGMEGAETSGAAYIDPHHKHYQLEASLGWRPATEAMPESVRRGETYCFLETFQRERPAGEQFVYTSANTSLLGALIETVTGQRLADVIAERLWGRLGAERDALLLENAHGVPIAHGGLVTTLRDLARFGLLFTPSGSEQMENVIPQRVIQRMLREGPTHLQPVPATGESRHASYGWDEIRGGHELVKGGFGDQLLYIHRAKDVVIAYVGTNPTLEAGPTLLPLRALIQQYF
jgi:CubicO group peptidase (beta-lactamase class C family)